jgi:hypothetical protein
METLLRVGPCRIIVVGEPGRARVARAGERVEVPA